MNEPPPPTEIPIASIEAAPADNTGLSVAVWTVIAFAVLPPIAIGLNYTLAYHVDPRNLAYLSLFAQGCGAIAVVAGLAWFTGLRAVDLGLARPTIRDLLLVPLIGFTWAAVNSWYARDVMSGMDFETYFSAADNYRPAPGVIGAAFAIIACIVSGASEELIFRAFLIPSLRKLMGSPGIAVGLSSLLFAITHLYQGQTAVVLHFACSLAIGAIYTYYPRVIPFALGHALCNLLLDYRLISGTGSV